MRVKRLSKFRKSRNMKIRNLIIAVVLLPFASIFIGYLITSLFILPSMAK